MCNEEGRGCHKGKPASMAGGDDRVEDDVDAEKLTRRLPRVTYSKHCIHTAFTDYLQCTLRAKESAKHLPRHQESAVDQNEIPERRKSNPAIYQAKSSYTNQKSIYHFLPTCRSPA